MAVRELVAAIPPILVAQLAITQPVARPLAQCRIFGSNDPTYGTVNWAPPTDNSAFAVIKAPSFKDQTPEPNRVWTKHNVKIFIAIVQSEVPYADENFNDEALAWIDAARQVIPANRRLYPASATMWPTPGDVRWELESGGVKERHPIYGVQYYGVEIDTCLLVTVPVQYQG